jgi:FtsP/CotA-like multicopper oxidase with cupredoxin domain
MHSTDTTTSTSSTSRREGKHMHKTSNLRRVVVTATVLTGIAGSTLVAGAATFKQRATTSQDLATNDAPAWPKIPPTCTTDCTITLEAKESSVTVADVRNGPQQIPVWGFGVNGGLAGLAGLDNAIKVPVGTTVTIILANNLPATAGPLALSFPSLAAADVSVSGSTYTIKANKVGTSVYEAGDTPSGPRQVAMGLVGALIVTPASCATSMCAYDTTAYQDEAIVALSDLDAEFAADPIAFDMSYYGQSTNADGTARRVYHTINGKAFPDTDVIDAHTGDNVLVRYVNASVKDHSMGLLGLHQNLLARNADPYEHPQSFVAPLIGPGETADVAIAVPAGARAGQRYPLTDQSHRFGGETANGFGGAMTFVNVWAGIAPAPPAAPAPAAPVVVGP